MGTVVFISKINRRNGIFVDFSLGTATSFVDGPVGIVHNQLFPKGIDKLSGASGQLKQVGVGGGELNGIAYFVTPQPATCADHHRVLLSGFHAAQGDSLRLFLIPFPGRNKFVIDLIIE